MKEKSVFFNPFRMMSPKLDAEALRLEELHKEPFSESISLEKGLLVMISKVMEMTRLLSKALFSGSRSQMDTCESLARELGQQEKALTRNLVLSGLNPELLTGLIRFPFRIERIGDMLESVLNCSRIKEREGIPFSDKAHLELDQVFSVLVDMMENFRDAIITPNKVVLDHVLAQSGKLGALLDEARLAHWTRLEMGLCSPEANSLYLDILDSIKATNEYLQKMSQTLLELGTAGAAAAKG